MYLSPAYTTAPAEADERVGAVYAALDTLGIPYTRFEHDATATMEDCAAVGKALEGTICKNLFLCNRQQTAFYLLTMPGDKPFHTKDLSAQIPGAVYCPTLDKVTEALRAAAQPGDLIITVGAGDIYKAGEKLLREE